MFRRVPREIRTGSEALLLSLPSALTGIEANRKGPHPAEAPESSGRRLAGLMGLEVAGKPYYFLREHPIRTEHVIGSKRFHVRNATLRLSPFS